MRIRALLLVLTTLLPGAAWAQQPVVASTERKPLVGVFDTSVVQDAAFQPPARDSIVNGLLIGAAIGGGLASLNYLDNECHGDPACAWAVVEGAAIGAGIGALIDWLIRPKPPEPHASRGPINRSFRPMFAAATRSVDIAARVQF